MTEYVTNRLHFITNTETILDFIKSNHVHDNPPPEFSFNSIKPMPDELLLPLNEHILSLSVLNMEICPSDETTKRIVLSKIASGTSFGKPAESLLPDRIEAIRKELTAASTNGAGIEQFESALSNYDRHRFFTHYDWRLVHWGTIDDVQSVTEATFHFPTSYLEFTTKWTPPIAAMQALANTFPSVRFKLKHRSHPGDPWKTEDIFAFPPFGY